MLPARARNSHSIFRAEGIGVRRRILALRESGVATAPELAADYRQLGHVPFGVLPIPFTHDSFPFIPFFRYRPHLNHSDLPIVAERTRPRSATPPMP